MLPGLLCLLVLTVACSRASSALFHKATLDTHNYYVLHHDPAYATLSEVAEYLNLEIIEKVGKLKDHWLARTEATAENSTDNDFVIDTHERMHTEKSLSSRGEAMLSAIRHLSRQIPDSLEIRAPLTLEQDNLNDDNGTVKDTTTRVSNFQDPLFPEQWNLLNEEEPENTMNVVPVWEKLKYTGKGVTVSVIDNGLYHMHRDIRDKFDEKSSYDFVDNKESPQAPRKKDLHGTQCAGVIASAQNNVCGVGVAYDAKIAGVRVVGKGVKPSDQAAAFNYGFQTVDIYSCSYGPRDDGMVLQYPRYAVQQALLNGVNNGRGGKGSIFVFATGNGGWLKDGDNCNVDAYVNSIYTIGVGALDYNGVLAPFSEACAAVMVVAYAGWSKGIRTIHNKDPEACEKDFRATSSAAPNAAGVFALALEARPDLTWRDIQYLCVKTAKIVDKDSESWEKMASKKDGGNRLYSYKYGFGALDAYEFVQAAEKWSLVQPQTWIEMPPVQFNKKIMWGVKDRAKMDKYGRFSGGVVLSKEAVTAEIRVSRDMMQARDFDSIEHVQVKVWVDHSKRGDIEVAIESPKNIVSVLGARRWKDDSPDGLMGWTFSTLKHWGETPHGTWKVGFKDQGDVEQKGRVIGFRVIFWGRAKSDSIREKYTLPRDDLDVFPPKGEVVQTATL